MYAEYVCNHRNQFCKIILWIIEQFFPPLVPADPVLRLQFHGICTTRIKPNGLIFFPFFRFFFIDPPDIVTEKSWIHSGEGFEANLVCIVHADPQPTVSKSDFILITIE